MQKSSIRPLIAAFCSGIILVLVFGILIHGEVNRLREKEINRITHDYVHFQNHIQDFFTSNINLMAGFQAYIQTFEHYNNEDIYSYLENLTRDNAYYIRDIGLIEETTIKWVYPLEGNEKALGVDLSKVEGQSAAIEFVKTNLAYHFDGPKQLVQGGTGYIIRMPILKDGSYWGIVSVVLDAEKVVNLFDQYEKECHLNVAMLNASSDDKLIFGDPAVINEKNLKFTNHLPGSQLTTYVVSTEGGYEDSIYLILLIIASVVIGVLVIRLIYRYTSETEGVKAKNDVLNRAAYCDRLTGLYNRGFLDIRLHEEIDHANRYQTPFSIVYFDLDHFKGINDKYGHGYGDKVLIQISETVGMYLRSCDLFGRWGGEEFVILMPAIQLDGALAAAEKVREIIEAIEHPLVGRVTASFGVAEYCPDEYAGSMMKRVDAALYRAKKEGRNRVAYSDQSTCKAEIQYRIGWRSDWNSGNDIIDQDHKELLRLGNKLVEDSYTIFTYEEAVSRYNEVLDHITVHFEREERILEEAGFAGLEEHKQVHEELLESAIAYRETLVESKINAQQFFNYLMKELIICHLMEEDIRFFDLFGKKA